MKSITFLVLSTNVTYCSFSAANSIRFPAIVVGLDPGFRGSSISHRNMKVMGTEVISGIGSRPLCRLWANGASSVLGCCQLTICAIETYLPFLAIIEIAVVAPKSKYAVLRLHFLNQSSYNWMGTWLQMFGTNPNVHQTKNPQSYNLLLSFCYDEDEMACQKDLPSFLKPKIFQLAYILQNPISLPLDSCHQTEVTLHWLQHHILFSLVEVF